MSGQGNQQYLMKIVFDDSQIKDVENRLKNAFGVGVKSGNSSGSSGSSPMKNLLKLGGIATGVAGLVAIGKKILDLTIDSSPMLKGMLQLFGNVVMFILRPIGDFIGYLLKPIMFYLLRYVAIPFYKHWAPFMQKWGTKIGEFIVAAIKFFTAPASPSNPAGYALDIIFPTKGIADLTNWLKSKDILGGLFDPTSTSYLFKPLLSVNLTSLWNTAIKPVTDFFDTLKNSSLTSLWNTAVTPLKSFFNLFQTNTLSALWNKAVTPITDFINSLKFTFGSTLQHIWNNTITSIYDFFVSLKFTFGSTLQHIWSNVVDAMNNFFQAIADFVKDPIGTIQKALTPKGGSTQGGKTVVGAPNITINIDKAMGDVSSWGSDLEQIINDAVKKVQNMGVHP